VRRLFGPVTRFFGRRSKAQLGVMFLVAIAVCSLALFNKNRLLVNLKPGEQLSAEFTSNYKLREYVSRVKIAGIKVGTVTAVSETDDRKIRIDMRLDKGTRKKLGEAPSARIRPATILGGTGLSAYVDLKPGGGRGDFAGTIPASRTSIPVELDRVLEVFDDKARDGLSASLGLFDQALADGGGAGLGGTLEKAPGALGPAVDVVAGLGGQQPGDLAALVDRLGGLAATLTADQGEIEAVFAGAAEVSRTLGRRAADFEALLADLPTNLTQARAGLDALAGTLRQLETTAPGVRPSVTQLRELFETAGPVLAAARPLLADLQPLLTDLDPLFGNLTPTAASTRKVLDDLDGPVIDRIQDPILTALNSGYDGKNTKLHQEFAYFLAGLDGVFKYTDQNGAALIFQSGTNEHTVTEGRPAGAPGATEKGGKR
jgi:phospholipid/cholesterol/gamma-HCH transport system substrate-binding protein